MKVLVVINGGPNNVHERYGLTANPFPAIPVAEFHTANRMLRELDADPLSSTDDVRRILSGCDQGFIDLCCQQFKIGERIRFSVTWPD